MSPRVATRARINVHTKLEARRHAQQQRYASQSSERIYPHNLCIPGTVTVTPAGYEYRIIVRGPTGQTGFATSIDVTGNQSLGTGTTTLVLSDSPIGASGATTQTLSLAAGTYNASQTAKIPVTVGDTLYVYFTASAQHQNLNISVGVNI